MASRARHALDSLSAGILLLLCHDVVLLPALSATLAYFRNAGLSSLKERSRVKGGFSGFAAVGGRA